jgi:predicted dehydrogenase
MGASVVRIGIAGCGSAARIHLKRLLALEGVEVVGCADPDQAAAANLADSVAADRPTGRGAAAPVFTDHRDLLRATAPDAIAIFTPHLAHYRVAMDALQAGCHAFIEKPLSTNVQEAADIVNLARGRGLKVAVGHQFRLAPSLIEARERLARGSIGRLQLVTCVLARAWLTSLDPHERSWRFKNDPPQAGGILSDAGDHLIDALLWTTGKVAQEVAAVQSECEPGIDVVTAAAIQLSDGTPVAMGVSGVSPGSLFALDYFGDRGRLSVTDQTLTEEAAGTSKRDIALNASTETIDGNFVAALTNGSNLCCPADQALDTVRLLEAIFRSAATGQMVRVV